MEITIRGNMQEIMALMGAMSKTEEQRPAKAQSAETKRHTGWNSADQYYLDAGLKILRDQTHERDEEPAEAPEGEARRAKSSRMSEMRKVRRMTQAELGDRVGITQSAVAKYENGEVRSSLEIATKIAAALDMTLDEM